MLVAWSLAVLAGPFVTLPSLTHGGDAKLVALASDPAPWRLYCFSTRCGDEEWRLALTPPQRANRPSSKYRVALPGTQQVIRLRAPATSRENQASYSNEWRIGTRYGVEAVRTPTTRLGLQFGAGYRLAPLHDDGVGAPGPVFRGELNFGQRLGERAQWTQRVQVETGNGDTFVKQSLGVDVDLWPAWTLEADVVIRHDSRDPERSGSETAESWMGIRRRF